MDGGMLVIMTAPAVRPVLVVMVMMAMLVVMVIFDAA
jgi:hypothetical protein